MQHDNYSTLICQVNWLIVISHITIEDASSLEFQKVGLLGDLKVDFFGKTGFMVA